ncbi:MAG: sodium:solute symporter [Hyphomicrobium sp.]|nr:sodium:solute symporter [Hyphomicrobium sp.]
MAMVRPQRSINPRLGIYLGIFLSLFMAIALLTLIFEGLGVGRLTLAWAMLLCPLALYGVIGAGGLTNDALDFFAAGRRVPAFYNGFTLATAAFGATGTVVLTGMLFFAGFDALCLAIGALAGFVVMAVMLAPFLRKFGTFTVPSYLGRRFDSRPLRLLSAAILSVPILMLLTAELRLAAEAASWLTGQSRATMAVLLAVILALTLVPGGMRSLTWASVAQGLAAFVALVVPVAIVAGLVTTLPLPQLTNGPVLRAIGRVEAAQGLPYIIPPTLAFDLPGQGLHEMSKRFADAFGLVGPSAFVMVTMTSLAGVAAAPWLLPRLASTPGVYEARKTLGWATFTFGISMLTAASIAVFFRDYVMDVISAPGPAAVPAWLSELVTRGLATINEESSRFRVSSFAFDRNGILLSLPIAAGLPEMLLNLSLVGVVAAGLAAAGAAVVSLGSTFGEDLIFGLTWEPPEGAVRIHASRIGIGLALAIGALAAATVSSDPFRLTYFALAFSGASLFPILVLSIWWKRLNAYGCIAGLSTGFSIVSLAILSAEGGFLNVDPILLAASGIPASALAAIGVSLTTPAPGRHVLELVRDIRVPGGEILYDREMRLQRQKRHRQRS